MDFFGFNTNAAADNSSQIGQMMRAATDPALDGPDWGKLDSYHRCTNYQFCLTQRQDN